MCTIPFSALTLVLILISAILIDAPCIVFNPNPSVSVRSVFAATTFPPAST